MLCLVSMILVSTCEVEDALEECRNALFGEHVLISAGDADGMEVCRSI